MLNKENIHIDVLCVNWFSSEMLINLFNNLLEISEYKSNMSFLIVDNTGNRDEALRKLPEIFTGKDIKIVPNSDADCKIGSQSHALGLNLGFKKLIASDITDKGKKNYILIIDPDVYILKSAWDKVLIAEMKSAGARIGGTVYPPWQLGKYHDFPNPVFLFAEKEFLACSDPNWMCYDENVFHRFFNIICLLIVRGGYFVTRERFLKYPFLAACFSFIERLLPVCSLETGYKLRKSMENISFVLLEPVCFAERQMASYFSTQPLEKQNVIKELTENFELYAFKGEPFLSHRYSSCSSLWKTRKSENTNLWKELCTCYNNFQNL